jgi:hypothetical protein
MNNNDGGLVADQVVEFRWLIRKGEESEIRATLSEEESNLEQKTLPFTPSDDPKAEFPDAAFGPLEFLVGAIVLRYLAQVTMKIIKDARHGGLIIDARGDVLEIREFPALDQGTVLIVGKDGNNKLLEPSAAKEIIEAIVAFVKGGQ